MPVRTIILDSHDLIQPSKFHYLLPRHVDACPDAEMQILMKARRTIRVSEMTKSRNVLAASEDAVKIDVAARATG